MKFLLVVFVLVQGDWVRGDDLEGWGSIAYATEEICLARKERAEQLHIDLKQRNPRAYDKRFVCEPLKAETGERGESSGTGVD